MAKYELSKHAQDVMRERKISQEWLDRVLLSPTLTLDDREDVELKHHLAKISEYEDRVLRVVVNDVKVPHVIVTAFFDRNMKDKL